MHILNWCIL